MTLKWIIGDFRTGAITETAELPVAKGSDKIVQNINNEDFANISVSKRDLPNPADWKEYLKPVYTMIAAVDTSKPWNSPGAVLFAGYVKEVRMGVRETITLQIAGMREYASNRQPTTVYSGNVPTPDAGKTFQGSDYQRLMTAVMNETWNSYGQGGNNPQPPQNKGTNNVAENTGSITYKNIQSQFLTISDILDDLRDNLSLLGNEYRFVPRWATAAKNKIVFDTFVAPDNQPQINFSTSTLSVNLDDENSFATSASNALTSTEYATRLVGISKQGDEEENSDYRIITASEPNSILVDGTFNPGVELAESLLNSSMTQRLNFQKNLQQEGEIVVIKNSTSDWLKVGSKVEITAGTANSETSGFNFTARLVEVEHSLSSTELRVTLMALKPKYGKLPKSPTRRNPLGKNPSLGPTPSQGPIVGYTPPNQPVPGGGGDIPTPEIPNFETDNQFPSMDPFMVKTDSTYPVSSSGMEVSYQDGQYIYYIVPPRDSFGIYSNTNSSYTSIEEMNTSINNLFASNLGPIQFRRKTFISDTNAPADTDLNMNLDLLETIGPIDELLPSFSSLPDGPVRNSVSFKTYLWVKGTEIFVWVLLEKAVNKHNINQTTSRNTVFNSYILKNSLTGNSDSWEVVKHLPNLNGEYLIYPVIQQAITVYQGKVYLAGAAILPDLATTDSEKGFNVGADTDFVHNLDRARYTNNIFEISPSGGIENVNRPFWTTNPQVVATNYTTNELTLEGNKIQVFVKNGAKPIGNTAVVLMPTGIFTRDQFYGNLSESSNFIAYTIFDPLSPQIVEMNSTQGPVTDSLGTLPSGVPGMAGSLFLYAFLGTPNELRATYRTKNANTQWIKASQDSTQDGIGRLDSGISFLSTPAGAVQNYSSQFGSKVFGWRMFHLHTYNNFWVYLRSGTLYRARGVFNS